MPQYKFHLLNDNGDVAEQMDRECKSDLEALDDAQSLCRNHEVEVWHGALHVLRVKRGNAPLNASDITSG